MNQAFDFFPTFRDINLFLAEELAWQVTNGEVFNVNNMNDQELRAAIIDDVLAITIWEKQTGEKAMFDTNTLCRFLTHEQRVRVKEAMQHEDIVGLLNVTSTSVRIRDQKETLQAAMAYAEVWFSGYDTPAGLVSLDREAILEMAEANGGIEQLAEAMLMEMSATHPSTSTMN